MLYTLNQDKLTEFKRSFFITKAIPMFFSAVLGILLALIPYWDTGKFPSVFMYSFIFVLCFIAVSYILEISYIKKLLTKYIIELSEEKIIVNDLQEKEEIFYENILNIKETNANIIIKQKIRPKEFTIYSNFAEIISFKKEIKKKTDIDISKKNVIYEKTTKILGYFLIITFLINKNIFLVITIGLILLLHQILRIIKILNNEKINIPNIYKIVFRLPIIAFIIAKIYFIITGAL